MLSEKAKQATRREWQELGFYYDRNDDQKKWQIIGSRDGLRKFADLIRRYADNRAHEGLSEHTHYGPYSYLEVGTWNVPQIDGHWVAGPLDKLRELADSTEQAIARQNPGERISLRTLFAPQATYDLEIEMRADGFDPATEDPNLPER